MPLRESYVTGERQRLLSVLRGGHLLTLTATAMGPERLI